jgi:urease accessory protein
MMGFAVATAMLHAGGIGVGLASGLRYRALTRAAGALCAAIGVGLAFGAF